MQVDKTKLGLTFKHPRVTREHQEAEIRRAGASWIVHIGKDCPSWRWAVRQLEPGDVVYVLVCTLIPAPKKQDGSPLAAQWTEFNKYVADAKAECFEVKTGASSKDKRKWKAVIEATHKWLAHGGKRVTPTRPKGGRPQVEWPSLEVETKWRKLWKSKNIASDAAAKRLASEDGVTVAMLRKLGPSGRN